MVKGAVSSSGPVAAMATTIQHRATIAQLRNGIVGLVAFNVCHNSVVQGCRRAERLLPRAKAVGAPGTVFLGGDAVAFATDASLFPQELSCDV